MNVMVPVGTKMPKALAALLAAGEPLERYLTTQEVLVLNTFYGLLDGQVKSSSLTAEILGTTHSRVDTIRNRAVARIGYIRDPSPRLKDEDQAAIARFDLAALSPGQRITIGNAVFTLQGLDLAHNVVTLMRGDKIIKTRPRNLVLSKPPQ